MRFKALFIVLLSFVFFAALPGCATRTSYVDLYGQPASLDAAQRTIVIRPDTRFINVEGGEIIGFKVGDKQFAWHFFVERNIRQFSLNDVAPPGILDHQVQVYLTPDPRYIAW